MNYINILVAALAVLVLGAVAPGCAPHAPPGSLCAAPAEGGKFCVDSNHTPASAWRMAKAQGSLPIQMWAERDSSVTLDQLVASEDALNGWFTNIDTVLSYVRDQQKCAECYKASMAGNLGALLRQAKDRGWAALSSSSSSSSSSSAHALGCARRYAART